MALTTSLGSARWTWTDRGIVAALLVVFSLGTPGLGIETREAPSDAVALIALYTLSGLLPLAALIASWKWPRPAAWSAVAAVLLAAVLAVVDLAGLMPPAPPPPAMVGVYAGVLILGAAIAWRMRRLLRA